MVYFVLLLGCDKMGKEVMGKKENEMVQEKECLVGSQSLFCGLMLIEILSNYLNGCLLVYFLELVGLNKSIVYCLLQGLQFCGYVIIVFVVGSYCLIIKFIVVGQKVLFLLNIIYIVVLYFEVLNIVIGEIINFFSCEDDYVILIYKLELIIGML